jgi:hypothetical protein
MHCGLVPQLLGYLESHILILSFTFPFMCGLIIFYKVSWRTPFRTILLLWPTLPNWVHQWIMLCGLRRVNRGYFVAGSFGRFSDVQDLSLEALYQIPPARPQPRAEPIQIQILSKKKIWNLEILNRLKATEQYYDPFLPSCTTNGRRIN